MNILIDKVPETVRVNDLEYRINTDFRTSILFEMLMQDNSIGDHEKIKIALDLYYPYIPFDIEGAITKMLYFYRCGKDLESNNVNVESTDTGLIYSFEHDAEYIYAAFLSQYAIDLQEVEYLHWWKFKALFKCLKEDNEIVKIMGYRSIKITSDMSKGQKSFYKKMKRIYKLPDNRTEEEKENMIVNSLAELF